MAKCKGCGKIVPHLESSGTSLCDDCYEASKPTFHERLAHIAAGLDYKESIKTSHTCTPDQEVLLRHEDRRKVSRFYHELCSHFATSNGFDEQDLATLLRVQRAAGLSDQEATRARNSALPTELKEELPAANLTRTSTEPARDTETVQRMPLSPAYYSERQRSDYEGAQWCPLCERYVVPRVNLHPIIWIGPFSLAAYALALVFWQIYLSSVRSSISSMSLIEAYSTAAPAISESYILYSMWPVVLAVCILSVIAFFVVRSSEKRCPVCNAKTN